MSPASHYRELICWQLSVRLRDGVNALTALPAVRSDRRFCEQINDSARSAPANIAEGFGRSTKEFVRYLTIATGSIRETETHLDEARSRNYIDEHQYCELGVLAKRAVRAAAGLSDYLRRRSAPQNSRTRT